MKRVLSTSILAALCIASANADGLVHRIYVGTFTQGKNDAGVDMVAKKLQDSIEGISDLVEVDRYISDKKEIVLFVDTKPVSVTQARELLKTIRQFPNHDDAFMKIKTKRDYEIVTENMKARGETASAVVEDTLAEPIAETSMTPEPSFVKPVSNANQEPLSLNSVIKTVLSENPNLKASEYNYLQVGKDLKIAKNAYYPTLDAMAYFGHENKRLDNGITTNTGSGRIGGANITLVENLYNGGADANRIKSQSHRLDSAAYSVAQTADRLALQMVDAYLALVEAKRILDIENENVVNHENIHTQIRDRAQSGFGVASEERQAGSRYTLAQSNLIAAQNNYDDAIATFEKLYGHKINPENLHMPEFNINLPATEKEVYDKAMLCNPSLLVQRSNIAMSESVVKEKNAPFRPKLDLEVSGNYEHTDVLDNNKEEATFDTLVRLRYNLYNKGIDKLEKEKSKLAVSQEQQNLDVLMRDLTESLKFSWQNYVLEEKRMAYLLQHVEYAKATLDSYQDEFRIGRRDLINLLDAETEYNSALKEITSNERALLYAKYRLLDNMGLISDSFEPGFAKRYIQGACSIENDLK
ncbi:hypothetical protein LMG7974_00670 [Campylobacter majalis]|uniref:Uncharacterized protein n=1 Tax=Campylobacter majalis TaxID=2790656 RepID=A0ABM8Q4H7_9BACT|nr:TolC family protein [Campylobacter majalis]CAD7287787.1 hypothetical protein LMG7974_00670 [Campylobacter majalis]